MISLFLREALVKALGDPLSFKRDCKGTHFLITSKLFSKKFSTIFHPSGGV